MKNRTLCLALGLSALATVGFAKKEQKNVLFIIAVR